MCVWEQGPTHPDPQIHLFNYYSETKPAEEGAAPRGIGVRLTATGGLGRAAGAPGWCARRCSADVEFVDFNISIILRHIDTCFFKSYLL
jgi:hypothetical protein